jgi:hypothetical protein
MAHDGLRPRNAVRQGRGATRFQRITGRNQPPNLIQPQSAQGMACDMDMALMRRIKRPTEKPNDCPFGRMGQKVAG